jgi:hypothetical protein
MILAGLMLAMPVSEIYCQPTHAVATGLASAANPRQQQAALIAAKLQQHEQELAINKSVQQKADTSDAQKKALQLRAADLVRDSESLRAQLKALQ